MPKGYISIEVNLDGSRCDTFTIPVRSEREASQVFDYTKIAAKGARKFHRKLRARKRK